MGYRMSFGWLKRYMPRSLYGRAALILILPVITVQLAVSVVFIQRHFEGVTDQMTRTMVLDLQLVLDMVNEADGQAAAARAGRVIATPLLLDMQLPATAPPRTGAAPMARWFDVSGRVVDRTMRERVPAVVAVDVSNKRRVMVWLETDHGLMSVEFARSRVSASNPHQLLVWMVVLGVFMTLIAYSFLRNQLRPITRLANAATEYGRGRVVTYHTSGANEVRAAGAAFLDMRNRIERQTQTRTMMLSGVSHDLRTPLTRLKLGLGMLDGADVEPLLRDVDDMQHLLDAFLDFARGDAEGDPEPTDPIALARMILADAKRMGQAVEAGELEGDAQSPVIPLRALAVRRAVENLIGNALRYGAEARLSVQMTPRAVVFCVEDDGPGIPADQREEAVRPFSRLDPARNQNKGTGVGLGLSIVSDIARAHGGSLRLSDSDDLGGLKAEIVLAR